MRSRVLPCSSAPIRTSRLSNDDIARALHISPLTVKTHVNRAMTKLGLRDLAQLVVIAYRTGMVRPGPGSGNL